MCTAHAGVQSKWVRPRRAASIVMVAWVLGSCGDQERPAGEAEANAAARTAAAELFALRDSGTAVYVVRTWDGPTARAAADSLRSASSPAGVASELVLRARDSTRVVQIGAWTDTAAARAWARGAAGTARRTLEFTRVGSAVRDGQPLAIAPGSSVQWSEFLMRRHSAVDTLAGIVRGVTAGMVRAQPTLTWVAPLRAADSSSVGLLGVWSTREGFEVFARQNTFGERGYWDPYATNEHAMYDVVALRGGPAPAPRPNTLSPRE